MKTRTTFFLLSFAIAGFILAGGKGFAQQKPDGQPKAKKTITIHVTKEADGKTTIVDTTVITDGDFDTDAFLEKKGVGSDLSKEGKIVEKHIVIVHPGSQEFKGGDSKVKMPDTIIIHDDRVLIYNDKFDRPAPPPPHMGMPYEYNFSAPGEFHHFEGPQFQEILEGMMRTFGLENVMPFGEMKQVVVKKKNKGKKVIITFEDRKGESSENGMGITKEEKVIIYNNGGQGMAPQSGKKVIVNGQPGENVVIHKRVVKTEEGDQVIINAEVEKSAPVKKETRVIIIKEDGTK